MLVDLRNILKIPYENNHAVGAFNGYNYETFRGIVEAGVEANQPVILAFGAKYISNMSFETAYVMAKSLDEGIKLPVCLHLDHCSELDMVFKAIRCGFGSVMYDGSALPFAENIKNTKMVCDVAHACGVSVEAELGCLAAGDRSHEGTDEDKEVYTDPMMAKQFVQETGVDVLAVSVGTVHGLYKGCPNLRYDILEEINRNVGIPLALHGGSGLKAEEVKRCIGLGIAKVNVNTEISIYAIDKTLMLLKESQPHFSELSLAQVGYVKEMVKKYIVFLH